MRFPGEKKNSKKRKTADGERIKPNGGGNHDGNEERLNGNDEVEDADDDEEGCEEQDAHGNEGEEDEDDANEDADAEEAAIEQVHRALRTKFTLLFYICRCLLLCHN